MKLEWIKGGYVEVLGNNLAFRSGVSYNIFSTRREALESVCKRNAWLLRSQFYHQPKKIRDIEAVLDAVNAELAALAQAEGQPWI